MNNLSTPVRYAIIGAVAGLIGYGLSLALGQSPGAPWWIIVIAMGIGGYVGGFFKDRRSK